MNCSNDERAYTTPASISDCDAPGTVKTHSMAVVPPPVTYMENTLRGLVFMYTSRMNARNCASVTPVGDAGGRVVTSAVAVDAIVGRGRRGAVKARNEEAARFAVVQRRI